MGINVNVSKPVDLSSNQYLQKFAGKAHITADNNEFWDEFLKFSIQTPKTSDDQLNMDSKLEPFLESFIQSNLSSGNLGSLVTVFLRKTSDLLALSDTERYDMQLIENYSLLISYLTATYMSTKSTILSTPFEFSSSTSWRLEANFCCFNILRHFRKRPTRMGQVSNRRMLP